jgi:thiamine pyrophosphokinase
LAELERLCVPVFADAEQDTNDLCKAFRFVMRSGTGDRIVILGATGKREDHAIGNIFHLADFAEEYPDIRIVTDTGIFEPLMPPGREWDGDLNVGRPISVFATHPETIMTSDGLKWPLDGVRFDTLWRGTLNRIVSTRFSIRTDRPVIIFRPHT